MPTPEELLEKLEERLILGEVSEKTYQDLRTKLLSRMGEGAPSPVQSDTADSPVTMPSVETRIIEPTQVVIPPENIATQSELRFPSGEGTQSFALKPGTTILIGREEYCDLCLGNDPLVSREHCRIKPNEAGGFNVVDLKSSHGTFVNGEKITDIEGRMLQHGDIIGVGGYKFEFACSPQAIISDQPNGNISEIKNKKPLTINDKKTPSREKVNLKATSKSSTPSIPPDETQGVCGERTAREASIPSTSEKATHPPSRKVLPAVNVCSISSISKEAVSQNLVPHDSEPANVRRDLPEPRSSAKGCASFLFTKLIPLIIILCFLVLMAKGILAGLSNFWGYAH